MAAGIAACVFALAGTVALTNPRFGAILIWFFIWMYPNTALYGTLPLNVRFDNLWALLIFLICLFSPQSRRTTSGLVWLSLLWVVSITLGGLAGLVSTGGEEWGVVIKDMARALYIPMTTYALYNLLGTEQHLDKYIRWMVLAAALAAILAIAMVHVPGPLNVFLIPKYDVEHQLTALERIEAAETVSRRAQGSVGTISLAVVMMCMSLLSLSMAVYHEKKALRPYFGIACGVCVVALAYTITRGAIGGFGVAVLCALLFTRRRGTLLTITILGAAVLLAEGSLVEKLMTRLGFLGDAGQSHLAASWETRAWLVEKFIEDFSVSYFLFGMGFVTVHVTTHATVHNTYLGSVVYCGVLGVVTMVLIIRSAALLGIRALKAKDDWLCQALGTYLIMLLISLLVYGVVAELFQTTMAMHLLFASMVFVQCRLEQLGKVPQAKPVRVLEPTPLIMAGPYVQRP